MPIFVGGIEIADKQVFEEMQYQEKADSVNPQVIVNTILFDPGNIYRKLKLMGGGIEIPIEEQRDDKIYQGGKKGNYFNNRMFFIIYQYNKKYTQKGQEGYNRKNIKAENRHLSSYSFYFTIR